MAWKIKIQIEAARRGKSRAFTLIELLTVIAIIGIVTGLVVASMSYVGPKRDRAKVEAELHNLVTAIEAYKARYGFYPPASTNASSAMNPLYYELCGTVLNSVQGTFTTLGRSNLAETISAANVNNYFKLAGFVNAFEGTDLKKVKIFLPSLKAKQYAAINSNPDIQVLVVPVQPTVGSAVTATLGNVINPWRYVSDHPTNNVNGFDLWAECLIGNQTNIVKNWGK